MKAGISFLLMLFLLVSCKKQITADSCDESDLAYKYFSLEKSGWKSKKNTQQVDDIYFTATEVPLAYYILKEKGADNLTSVDSIENVNSKERILEFEFLQDEEQDLLKEEFTGRTYEDGVKYMSFSIENDFYVVTSKQDTIKCAGTLFERSFKLTPYKRVLLFFSGIEPDDEIQLIYNDRLYNKGTMKFKLQENLTKVIL
ncbi:hypothetical protein [Flavobacterium sp. C4GT6]|uniref:hypothetical protein n=1 Tax=Flavobacterium sp. C4GT6 TaxID=3103818 RepID=UPI002ED3A8DB